MNLYKLTEYDNDPTQGSATKNYWIILDGHRPGQTGGLSIVHQNSVWTIINDRLNIHATSSTEYGLYTHSYANVYYTLAPFEEKKPLGKLGELDRRKSIRMTTSEQRDLEAISLSLNAKRGFRGCIPVLLRKIRTGEIKCV